MDVPTVLIYSKDARSEGETEQRLYALTSWRETPFFTARERAALAWTEALTLITEGHVQVGPQTGGLLQAPHRLQRSGEWHSDGRVDARSPLVYTLEQRRVSKIPSLLWSHDPAKESENPLDA